ncbi:MAG: hypothetical protein JSV09_07005 [Thermoplasmata archaeon]|nr:MAG: hypothetical protein JSV09_07005 [Thermoplasmata archaeon]
MHNRTKVALMAGSVFLIGIMAIPMTASAGVEFYDPLPDVPGKFMGPHGPQHTEWHYHGPPQYEEDHCHEAMEDPNAPEGVHHHCEEGHH